MTRNIIPIARLTTFPEMKVTWETEDMTYPGMTVQAVHKTFLILYALRVSMDKFGCLIRVDVFSYKFTLGIFNTYPADFLAFLIHG